MFALFLPRRHNIPLHKKITSARTLRWILVRNVFRDSSRIFTVGILVYLVLLGLLLLLNTLGVNYNLAWPWNGAVSDGGYRSPPLRTDAPALRSRSSPSGWSLTLPVPRIFSDSQTTNLSTARPLLTSVHYWSNNHFWWALLDCSTHTRIHRTTEFRSR